MELSPKGPLQEVGFIKLLLDSMEAKRTGMVRIESGQIIKVVYMQQGSVAFASSNEKTDRLTEVLKRAGKLTPEQIEHAQARLRPNVSLGKTLVELGYISPRDLLSGARMQVESILQQLLFWNQGNYQIIDGPLPKEIVSLSMSVPQIIFDGILKSRDRQWVLQHIGSPESVYQLDPGFHEMNALSKLPVEETVSRMNGKRSLEEIAHTSGQDTFDVCKMVAALEILGMAHKAESEAAPIVTMVESPREQQAPAPFELNPIAPKQDLSLGQVLQLPTVEELQSASHRETTFAAPSPATSPGVSPPDVPSFLQEKAPEKPEELFAPPTTRLRLPEILEEQDTENVAETIPPPQPREMPAGRRQEPSAPPQPTLRIDQATERYAPLRNADQEEAAVPLESMSRRSKARRPGYRTSPNWKKLAFLMGIVAVIAVAATFAYREFFGKPVPRDYPHAVTQRVPKPIQRPKPPVTVEPAPATTTQEPAQETPSQAHEQPPVTTTQPPVHETPSQAPAPAQVNPKPAASTLAATPLELVRSGKIPDAAAFWKKELRPRSSRYTIQIEIACQEDTVLEAFNILDNTSELSIVPLDYHGRACYRVLYGVYSSAEQAQSARARLPQEFLKQQSPAQVIPVSKALK